MGVFDDLLGTLEEQFHVGSILGPMFKKNGDHVDVRLHDDSNYANIRVQHPVIDHDAATKLYVDTSEGVMIVSGQENTSAAIPNNTGTRRFLVVTTAGSGANIGDVLYDDGSSTGTMTILTAKDGRTIFVTQPLSGGTISLDGDSMYSWDVPTSSYLKVGDIGSVVGSERMIRYTIAGGTAFPQDSVNQIPANSRVTYVSLEITTAFPGGVKFEIGNSTTSNLLMPDTKNTPQVAHKYVRSNLDVAWGGSADEVSCTQSAGSAPATGNGVIVVKFATPLG